MTREQLINEMECTLRNASSMPGQQLSFCESGVLQVLALLKQSQTEQKKGPINLPEPTPEMLYAVYGDNRLIVDLFSSNTEQRLDALTRYNRLKEILARPATKTVTMYVMGWMHENGTPDATTITDRSEAEARERRMVRRGFKHVTITEIQQTVDDTTNS